MTILPYRIRHVLMLCLFAASGRGAEGTQDPPRPAGSVVVVDQPRISPTEKLWLESALQDDSSPIPVENYAIARPGLERYAILNAEFADSASCAHYCQRAGDRVLFAYLQFATVFIKSRQDLDEALSASGLLWAEAGPTAIAPPTRFGPASSRGQAETPVRNGLNGYTGRGVIIAVVDSGIDFRNRDFITRDASNRSISRILQFWDTLSVAPADRASGARAPACYPGGMSIGTLYSRDDINRELTAPEPSIAVWDTSGHGTACAGIAAGNGDSLNGRYAGVAPQADLIAVRIGTGPDVENTFLLGRVLDWLDQTAGSRPLVISCSFSAARGGRDGSSVLERLIAARFPADRPGRALCVAAGNWNEYPLHARIQLNRNEASLSWWSGPGASVIRLHFGTDDIQRVFIRPGERTNVLASYIYVHPLTRQVIGEIRVGAGPGEITVGSRADGPLRVDAYIDSFDLNGRGFTGAEASDRKIGIPGMASSVITVGSYNFNDQFELFGQQVNVGEDGGSISIGALSSYSSRGLIDESRGVVKPEIAAPGQFFIASAAANAPALRDTSGRYRLFNGTSAATPYVSGLVALMMEKDPTLTATRIKQILRRGASVDPRHFNTRPYDGWGYGKLDLDAASRILDAVPATAGAGRRQ